METIKKVLGLLLLLCLSGNIYSQYIGEIVEYRPAPGQFINTDGLGSHEAAESLVGGLNGIVSLGGFGGSITVKMENAVENDPQNPFGIDFTIFGNALPTWSEPALVYVMRDDNNNGLADDNWFLLAGSDYFWNTTIPNYSLQYERPENISDNISWSDNQGNDGFIYRNSFHEQEYFPTPSYFPELNQATLNYENPLIDIIIDSLNPSFIKSYKKAFGFADNQQYGTAPYTIPDNPYTTAKENSGGDAFDIDWAVDDNGNYVSLDEIHFIRIVNCVNKAAGRLGEVSTEISGIIDVSPDASITGQNEMICIKEIPKNLIIGDEIQMYANHFINGRLVEDQNIIWSVNNNHASISNSGILNCDNPGTITIQAILESNNNIYAEFETEIVEPKKIIIHSEELLAASTEHFISIEVLDNNDHNLYGLDVEYELSDESIAGITTRNDSTFIQAIEKGTCYLISQLTEFPEIKDSIRIQVFNPEKRTVFMTVKNKDQIIFPLQKVSVELSDIEDFVVNPLNSYSQTEVPQINLAHSIIQAFINNGTSEEFSFKDDNEGGGLLYINKIPATTGNSIDYIYGFGLNENIGEVWMVKHNSEYHLNNFDQILVEDNDTISVFYVEDRTNPYTHSLFYANYLNPDINQEIKFTLVQEEVVFDEQNGFQIISDLSPVRNQQLFLNEEVMSYNGSLVMTNQLGEALYSFDEDGSYIVSALNNDIKIKVGDQVGFAESKSSVYTLYPNPANNEFSLRFEIDQQPSKIEIISMDGKIVKSFIKPKSHIFNICTLKEGIYVIRVLIGKQVTSTRLIVKH
jgi:hypothetical protein